LIFAYFKSDFHELILNFQNLSGIFNQLIVVFGNLFYVLIQFLRHFLAIKWRFLYALNYFM